jgi:DNA (cytosine-5)-methyltransferase 1
MALVPEGHMRRIRESGLKAVPIYKRVRNGRQMLELRFYDVAGCLRAPGAAADGFW